MNANIRNRVNMLKDLAINSKGKSGLRIKKPVELTLGEYSNVIDFGLDDEIRTMDFSNLALPSNDRLENADKVAIVNLAYSECYVRIRYQDERYNVSELGYTAFYALIVACGYVDSANIKRNTGSQRPLQFRNVPENPDITEELIDDIRAGACALLQQYFHVYIRKSAVTKGGALNMNNQDLVKSFQLQSTNMAASRIQIVEISPEVADKLFTNVFDYADCFLTWAMYTYNLQEGLAKYDEDVVLDRYKREYPNDQLENVVNGAYLLTTTFITQIRSQLKEFKLVNELNTVEKLNQFVTMYNFCKLLMGVFNGTGSMAVFIQKVYLQCKKVVDNLIPYLPYYHTGCPTYEGKGVGLVDASPIIVETIATIGEAFTKYNNSASRYTGSGGRNRNDAMNTPMFRNANKNPLLVTMIVKAMKDAGKGDNKELMDQIRKSIVGPTFELDSAISLIKPTQANDRMGVSRVEVPAQMSTVYAPNNESTAYAQSVFPSSLQSGNNQDSGFQL